jgi:hypothetical protein
VMISPASPRCIPSGFTSTSVRSVVMFSPRKTFSEIVFRYCALRTGINAEPAGLTLLASAG